MTRFLEPTMTFVSAPLSADLTHMKERCANPLHLGWKQKLVGNEWRCECGERLVPANG
jgi:hypothetical protein